MNGKHAIAHRHATATSTCNASKGHGPGRAYAYRCPDEDASFGRRGVDPARRRHHRLRAHDARHRGDDHRARREPFDGAALDGAADDAKLAVHPGAVLGIPGLPSTPRTSSNVPPPSNSLTMKCEEYNGLDADTQLCRHPEDRLAGRFGDRSAEHRDRQDACRRDVPVHPHQHRQRTPPRRVALRSPLASPRMGETFESLAIDVDGHVAQVTLLGPGKGNAMGPAFWAEMPWRSPRSTPTPTSGPSC